MLKTQQRLGALLARLQALFRDTDVVCQYADDQLLLLLPHTNVEDGRSCRGGSWRSTMSRVWMP